MRLHEEDKQVFVRGSHALNRAIHEDVVAVRVLPKEQWCHPSSLVVQDDEEDVDDDKVGMRVVKKHDCMVFLDEA